MAYNNATIYFLSGPKQESDKRVITQQLKINFKDVYKGIGCFDWMFSLLVRPDSKQYQVTLRSVAYALQKPFTEDLEWLKQQDIITQLGMDETAEWYNSLVLVLEPNGKVRLCLHPVRLSQVLIRLVHKRPTLNDIFPKLKYVKCLPLIDVSLEYHNLRLDERFACQFGRYRY